MIKQIFHLIWNTKRKNSLLFIEILISFLVLFGVYTFLVTGYNTYQVPLGFAVDDIYTVSLPFTDDQDSLDRIGIKTRLQQELRNRPEVMGVSFSNFALPFTQSGWSSNTFIEEKEAHSFFLVADEYFSDTYALQLVRGRWFDEADANSGVPSIVINQLYADQYLRHREPLNTHIQVNSRERKVVGVIDHYKYQSDYLAEHPMTIMFEPSRSHAENFLSVRVKPGTPAIFEMQLGNMIENRSLSGFQIKKVTNERISANRLFKIPMYILLFLCTFLILNVALGLFGVVWYNINNRTAEIGLRQAVGATKAMINFQLVGEQLAIALVSIVVGFIVAIQFPILNVFNLDGSIYFMGIFLATVTVLLIILVCSFLPGRRASRIHPATALHEE